MKKQPLLFSLVMLFFMGLHAQDVKFGKEDLAEIQETVYAKDSSVAAAYLYKYRYTYYEYLEGKGFLLNTEIHEKLKIYTNDGLEYASKSIPLTRFGSRVERLSDLKGFTYNLVNGKVVKTKLGKESIFSEEQSENINLRKFTMPEAKEGSVLEYKYKISSPFYYSIDEFVFQEDIPVKKLFAKLSILEWFKFNKMQKGSRYLKPLTSSRLNTSIGIASKELTYKLDDIEPLVEESFVANMDNYRLGMNFEIVSVEIPGQLYESYAKTWENVAESIYKTQGFGGELRKSNFYKDDVEALRQEYSNPYNLMYAVFNQVKSKVQWNQKYGVYADQGVRSAYMNGKGSVADINLLLVSMLNSAGISAYPVLVSTRQHGVPMFPTIEGFNYVIASAEIEGNRFLLDATAPLSIPNILPMRTLNWVGRRVGEGGRSSRVNLNPLIKASETTMISAKLDESGELEGQCNSRFGGHAAYMTRAGYFSGSEESYVERMESGWNIEIDSLSFGKLKQLTQPLNQKYSFYKENVLEEISGKYYLNPMLYMEITNNPFTAEERAYTIELGYPRQNRFLINIDLPEGFEVEHMPESYQLALPQNSGIFQFSLSQVGRQIQLQCNLNLNYSTYSPDYYPALKEFFNQVLVKNQEKIVLVKT